MWLVYVLVGSAVMLNHKADGTMVTRTLRRMTWNLKALSIMMTMNGIPRRWMNPAFISTDNDPHIIWRGEAWLETVELDAVHYLPPGSVALYYLRPARPNNSETQKVFARVSGENQYTFDLGGLTVTRQRIAQTVWAACLPGWTAWCSTRCSRGACALCQKAANGCCCCLPRLWGLRLPALPFMFSAKSKKEPCGAVRPMAWGHTRRAFMLYKMVILWSCFASLPRWRCCFCSARS